MRVSPLRAPQLRFKAVGQGGCGGRNRLARLEAAPGGVRAGPGCGVRSGSEPRAAVAAGAVSRLPRAGGALGLAVTRRPSRARSLPFAFRF